MREWLLRGWYRWWIWVLYALRLRRPLNRLQRWLTNEHRAPRRDLKDLKTPDNLRQHLVLFNWRRDQTRIGGIVIPLDYVSAPEVTEARLRNGAAADGDCDDCHHYAAVQLQRMEGVDDALHVSVGYPGGGHLACIYRFRGGWWLINYGRVHQLLNGPAQAADVLMRWAGYAESKPRWLLFETTDFVRVREFKDPARWEAETPVLP